MCKLRCGSLRKQRGLVCSEAHDHIRIVTLDAHDLSKRFELFDQFGAWRTVGLSSRRKTPEELAGHPHEAERTVVMSRPPRDLFQLEHL